MKNIIKVPLYFVIVILLELIFMLIFSEIKNDFLLGISKEIFIGTIITLIATMAIFVAAHDFSKSKIVKILKNILRG